jgi:histone-lysine N-methyltransferase SETD2
MILVEKEKKGHSYSTTRHPTLSEEKKAKMKSFVKEYTHKVLKKLKEKGKLKRQTTNDLSTPTSTPALSTPLTMSTPSGNLATPNGHSDDHEDLVDDIFGADDVDMDIDEPRSPSPVKVTKVNGTNGFSSMKVDSFRPTRTPRTPPLNGGPSPEKSADAAVGQ